jgi:hypothetical protein
VSNDFLFWLIAPFAVTAAVVVWALAREAEHRRRLRWEGRTATAHVSSLGYEPGDGLVSGSYWARVQYDDGGDFVTTKVSISGAEYRSYREGTRVLVSYLPGQPTSARRTSELERGSALGARHVLGQRGMHSAEEEDELLRRLTR